MSKNTPKILVRQEGDYKMVSEMLYDEDEGIYEEGMGTCEFKIALRKDTTNAEYYARLYRIFLKTRQHWSNLDSIEDMLDGLISIANEGNEALDDFSKTWKKVKVKHQLKK